MTAAKPDPHVDSGTALRTRRALLGGLLVALALLAGTLRPASAPRIAAAEPVASHAGWRAVSSASTLAPLPDRMARVGSAQQLIVATGGQLHDTTGTLQFFDYERGAWACTLTVGCRFGKHGLLDGTKRVAGNKTTPTGIWAMPSFIFGTHAKPPSGTKMLYRRVDRRSWWSSKRGRSYNVWVEKRRWTGERLWVSPTEYEFAVSTGYNARPNRSVYGRGSGIFLHVRGKGLTSGCVSLPRWSMIRICRLLDPSKHPAFAVGTLATGTPTSILAY